MHTIVAPQWYEMHTNANFEKSKTHFLKQIILLKSTNSLIREETLKKMTNIKQSKCII